MTMPRRLICCMVFVTLLWRAFADYEENLQDTFKNNNTRFDFGNLLQSLIKLNEQRVNVLQRLYKLEDYSVLSEVLRSSSSKDSNGNNMVLVVVAKNQSVPTRRSMDLQIVESIPSLNPKTEHTNKNPIVRSKNIRHQVKHSNIFEPTSVTYKEPNISHDNIDYGVFKVPKNKKGRFQIDDGRHHKNIITTNSMVPEGDHFLKYPELDNVELKDNSKKHNSFQDYVEDENRNIYSKNANGSLKLEGETSKNSNIQKYKFDLSMESKLQSSSREESSKEDYESNNLSIPKEIYEVNNRKDKFPNTPNDVTHVENSNKNPDIPKDKHNEDNNNNRYSNTITNDIHDLDHNNKYTNTPKDIHDLDQTNKNIPNQLHNVHDLTNENTKILKKILTDHVGGFPKILKDMYNADHSYKYPESPKQAHDVSTDKSHKIARESYDVKFNPKYPEIPDDVFLVENNNPKISEDVDDAEGYDDLHTMNYDVFDKRQTEVSKDKTKVDSFDYPQSTNEIRTSVDNIESRKTFKKCINKQALKLCSKSCISAYKNVCSRLKCSSKAKKVLKKECKRSCKKTFSSSKSSKYSSEDRS